MLAHACRSGVETGRKDADRQICELGVEEERSQGSRQSNAVAEVRGDRSRTGDKHQRVSTALRTKKGRRRVEGGYPDVT